MRVACVPRSSAYYQGKPAVSDDDLALMKRLDAIHLQHPFLGSPCVTVVVASINR
jgi:hypothetical protein